MELSQKHFLLSLLISLFWSSTVYADFTVAYRTGVEAAKHVFGVALGVANLLLRNRDGLFWSRICALEQLGKAQHSRLRKGVPFFFALKNIWRKFHSTLKKQKQEVRLRRKHRNLLQANQHLVQLHLFSVLSEKIQQHAKEKMMNQNARTAHHQSNLLP